MGQETPALLLVLGGEDELHFPEPGVWWEGDEAGVASWGDGAHLSPQLHSVLMFHRWWHSLQSWRGWGGRPSMHPLWGRLCKSLSMVYPPAQQVLHALEAKIPI